MSLFVHGVKLGATFASMHIIASNIMLIHVPILQIAAIASDLRGTSSKPCTVASHARFSPCTFLHLPIRSKFGLLQYLKFPLSSQVLPKGTLSLKAPAIESRTRILGEAKAKSRCWGKRHRDITCTCPSFSFAELSLVIPSSQEVLWQLHRLP